MRGSVSCVMCDAGEHPRRGWGPLFHRTYGMIQYGARVSHVCDLTLANNTPTPCCPLWAQGLRRTPRMWRTRGCSLSIWYCSNRWQGTHWSVHYDSHCYSPSNPLSVPIDPTLRRRLPTCPNSTSAPTSLHPQTQTHWLGSQPRMATVFCRIIRTTPSRSS